MASSVSLLYLWHQLSQRCRQYTFHDSDRWYGHRWKFVTPAHWRPAGVVIKPFASWARQYRAQIVTSSSNGRNERMQCNAMRTKLASGRSHRMKRGPLTWAACTHEPAAILFSLLPKKVPLNHQAAGPVEIPGKHCHATPTGRRLFQLDLSGLVCGGWLRYEKRKLLASSTQHNIIIIRPNGPSGLARSRSSMCAQQVR